MTEELKSKANDTSNDADEITSALEEVKGAKEFHPKVLPSLTLVGQ